MKVNRLTDKEGNSYCFSISNTLLSKKGAVNIVRNHPDSKIIKAPKLFRSTEPFTEFTVNSKSFYIEEPWGDSSEFIVMCRIPNTHELEELAKSFESHTFDFRMVILWLLLLIPLIAVIYERYS